MSQAGLAVAAGPTRRPRPTQLDASIVLIVGAIDMFLFVAITTTANPILTAAIVAPAYIPLLWRRIYPIPVFAIVWVHVLVCFYLFPELTPTLGLIMAVFAVAAGASLRTAGVTLGMTLLLAPAASIRGELLQGPHSDPVKTAVAVGLFIGALTLVSWGLGRWARRNRSRIDDFEQLTRAAAAAARAAERRKIALELHDILSHAVSVMVLQADGARAALASNPAQAEAAMERIGEVGRDSVDELRTLLGVLREDFDETVESRPPARLSDLPSLVDEAKRNGLQVRLETEGVTPDVPASFELSVHRIVKECLANSLKHSGPGTEVDIRLDWTEETLEIRVGDNGAGHRSHPELTSGYGLPGLRERARSLGGVLDAGPRPDGPGYLVTATLPTASRPSAAGP